jgi:hypothetical protein
VGWTFLYLMVFLKLPILALLTIVYWAVKATPEGADQPGGDGGVKDRPHPRHPRRPWGRGPRRRDPHGAPAPPSPPRVRTAVARARQLER